MTKYRFAKPASSLCTNVPYLAHASGWPVSSTVIDCLLYDQPTYNHLSPRHTMKSYLLAANLLAALVMANPAQACTDKADRWLAGDKAAHFGVSVGLGMAASQVTSDTLSAFGLALLPGVAKEIYDSQQSCNHFSWKDMAWDAVGAYVGVRAGNWYFGPKGIGYRTSF